MKDFFEEVINANKEIQNIISTCKEDLSKSISLGAGGDISSKIDLLAEEVFIRYLKNFGNIYSEECGFVDNKKELDVIIDPIDGSDNFASNFPYYGTSVALKKSGRTIAGVIVNLANNDIFIKDNKRFLKGKLCSEKFIHVEKNISSKIGLFERAYSSFKTPEILRQHNIKYRSPGAFALSLAYAHEVDFVLYEGKKREFDIAAGLFMCEDLHVKNDEKILLVSKDKEIFGKMSQFIK
ncbi:inositol monophosphatase family protein [Sulfurospirillum sp. 1307]|jgi:myo-inositol-1(or 4)-monophosphatase